VAISSNAETVLEALVSAIHAVLGDDLVGIYLYGSYVSGGFDAGVSDLDLVAVTSAEVETLDLRGLERMHRDVAGRHPEWTNRIEVVYIGRATLGSFRTSTGRLAVISPGEPFHVRDERVAEWVQNWYLVRESGVTLFGPLPAEVVPPVAWEEFVAAAARYADQIADQDLHGAAPGALAYSLLTMCRAHLTVHANGHGTKQEGAEWVIQRHPEWTWLVDAALRCRLSRGTSELGDEAARDAARELIGLLAAEIKSGSPSAGGHVPPRSARAPPPWGE
jgi:predicted nucleotidyltransferase